MIFRLNAVARTATAHVVLAGAFAGTTLAQDGPGSANQADVESIDSVIGAVYDVISGPAGANRDWDRMR